MTAVSTVSIKQALISVSDKTGIEAFARGLTDRGIKLHG